MDNNNLEKILTEKIKQLNAADVQFCEDRWSGSKSLQEKQLAREESNKVTFARQELQAILAALQPSTLPLIDIPKKCSNCDKSETDQMLVKHDNYLWCLDCMRLAGHCISCDADIRLLVEDYFMYDDDECPNCNSKSVPLIDKGSEEKDLHELIVDGIMEGSEQWKAEYDNCRAILKELAELKSIKDNEGKTDEYLHRQPKAWEDAVSFLSKYTHF